jgi:hypothetical protein
MNLHPNLKFTLTIFLKILLVLLPLFFYFRFWINPYLIVVYEVILVILFLLPYRYKSKILANIEKMTNRLPVSKKRKKNIVKTIERVIF